MRPAVPFLLAASLFWPAASLAHPQWVQATPTDALVASPRHSPGIWRLATHEPVTPGRSAESAGTDVGNADARDGAIQRFRGWYARSSSDVRFLTPLAFLSVFWIACCLGAMRLYDGRWRHAGLWYLAGLPPLGVALWLDGFLPSGISRWLG